MTLAASALLAVAALFLLPDPAWAWGPATHVYLGTGVLDALHLVPPAVRALLAAYPHDFLYGSVAADISLAKKYVPEGRHCHHWHVGEEIFAEARTDRLRSMALGYLAHLAADTVAHNTYVPRQLLLTSSSKGLGHSYWEHRMDVQLGERYTNLARHVVMDHDHSEADALFDRVLSATLFSFQTNRRIFRGMIRFQDNDRWHSIFGSVLQNSRWTLSDDIIEAYVVRSFDYVVDYLGRRGGAIAAGLDPIGERNLLLSKQVRRMALREGKENATSVLVQLADDFFPMPEIPFGHWGARVASNGSSR
ncbi:MAG TPA: zinc dependent phospholipase C family protein [Longimicrobiaceae bacterium]|nr:zinc dependent phospholipase C family protein [Longimicrobiaceae bacterium]